MLMDILINIFVRYVHGQFLVLVFIVKMSFKTEDVSF